MLSITHLPRAVALELTYRCNHKCIFCSCPWYAPHSTYPKGEELSVEQWKRAIDRLYENGVLSFSISGGEVTLKEGFEDILIYIRTEGERRGINNVITLISNGLAMKEEYLHLFKKLNVHLSMSLPGYTTFKEHTGVDNAKGVLTWFRKAKEIGLQTTVNVTVTQKNYFEIFETVSVGLINGASDVLLNRFLPGGRGLEYMDSLTLNKEQLNGMLDTTEEVLSLSKRRGHIGTEFPYCIINSPSKYERLSIGTQCAAAKQFFVVGPSGEIRACNHSPRIVGNIFAQDIITDIEYWNDFALSNYKPEPCKSCGIVELCDCGCREVANILLGSHKEVDPCIKGK